MIPVKATQPSELHDLDARKNGVELHLALGSATTRGDFDALVLAAGNLIQNAVQYSPPGSSVTVSCDGDGHVARLRVLDAGPGIPVDEIARLTQPFQRGTQMHSTSGAGLGLALVQAIMEAHGGRLSLSNGPSRGLCAELLLPYQP